MEPIWPLRSMLFIPAHKLDWVRRVQRFAPDSVVLDLEDAVPRELKAGARAQAREGIAVLREFGIAAAVRINAFEDGGAEDVAAIVSEGLAAIVLPKARSTEEVRELDRLVAYAEGGAGLPYGSVAILPLPETAEGLWAARDLAAASPRVRGLVGVIGGPVGGDVARAVGFRPTLEGAEQLYLASKIVLDSRAAGAPYPMASIIGTQLDDLDAVGRLVGRARGLGFAGVLLIHPSHVAVANAAFTPTAEEARYFAGLIEAIREGERRGAAAVSYRGAMIDYAMLGPAEEVLRDARRRGVAL